MTFTDDQKKVIETRGKDILVSASAGSGKTAVLTERIVRKVCEKSNETDIDRILIVTFTNAAASEMRERIRQALKEKSDEDPSNEWIKRQVLLVDHAQITTIDSFCMRLLENHFEEAGLDPGFSVADTANVKIMLGECADSVMEDAYYRENELYDGFYEDFIALTDSYAYKGRDDAITGFLIDIHEFLSSLPYPEKWLDEAEKVYESEDAFEESVLYKSLKEEVFYVLCRALKAYDKAIEISENAGVDKYVSFLENEMDKVKECAGKRDLSLKELSEKIRSVTFETFPTVRGEDAKEERERAKGLRDDCKAKINALKDRYFFADHDVQTKDLKKASTNVKALLYLERALMKAFRKAKDDEKLIDFSDMEHFALRILRDEEGNPTKTALSYREYYKEIMIDEYQDSNEVQELILSAIANEEEHDRFMVGDMKQSIYKFRMACPEIFLEKYDFFDKEGKGNDIRIDLKKNFRSRREVLNAVNDVFSGIMRPEVGGMGYDEDAALYEGAEYPEGKEGEYDTELLIYTGNDKEGNRSERDPYEGEGKLIAGRIKSLIESGRIKDKESGQLRRIRYDDIAILVRSMGDHSRAIEETLLKEGIPVRTASEKGYFDTLEVMALLDMLRITDHPGLDEALGSVLKSPLYGFTDEELADIVIETKDKKNISLYERLKLSESDKAKAFLTELSEYRRSRKRISVYELLYKIIKDHDYLKYVTTLPGGEVRKTNVEMLLQKALDYEKAMQKGLFGFLRYIKQIKNYEIEPVSGDDEQSGCVRMLTIHKSKGLEFPICFVSALSKGYNFNDEKARVMLNRDLYVGIEMIDPKKRIKRNTLIRAIISARLLREQIGEEIRVFYVALTRAKEKLIMTGVCDDIYGKADKAGNSGGDLLSAKSPMDLLINSMGVSKKGLRIDISVVNEDDIKEATSEREKQRALDEGAFRAYIKENRTGRAGNELFLKIDHPYPHAELEGLYSKTSVSELKHAAIEEDVETEVMFETDVKKEVIPHFIKEEDKDSLGGTRRGNAYHRFMERLCFAPFTDITDDEDILKEINAQTIRILKDERMRKEETDLIDTKRIVKFIKSDLARRMQSADKNGKLKKEQPFVMEIPAGRLKEGFPENETILIQGIIDAFFEEDGDIVLMDYKTDRVDKITDLIKRYKVQTEYYKEALSCITGKNVKEIFLYSFSFSESIAI